MEIRKITENKESFMDLLLLGDEQENMIKKYLDRQGIADVSEIVGQIRN